jgi:DNA-binding CsgD family transcriptional regulator
VLQWTIDGQTPAELARALQVREEVIGTRLRTILRKLQFDLAADTLSLQG